MSTNVSDSYDSVSTENTAATLMNQVNHSNDAVITESTVLDEISATSEAAEAIIAVRTNVPPTVRTRIEELFTAISAAQKQAEKAGKNWMKSEQDKKNLVELVGLLYEYQNTIPEFTERTASKVSALSIRKFLSSHSSLSAVESKAIELLQDELITIEPLESKGTRRSFDDEQKKYVISLLRLLRKRDLTTDAANSFLEKLGLSASMVNAIWKKQFEDENGVPTLTSELLADVFKRAEQELNTLPEQRESDATMEQAIADVSAIEQVSEPLKEPVQEDHEPVEPMQVEPLAPTVDVRPIENIALLQEMIRQNQQLIQILQDAESNSPKAIAVANLLSFNQSTMSGLMGLNDAARIDANVDSKPANAFSVTGNEIQLSPETMQKIEDGKLVATVTIDERGSGTVTEVHIRAGK